MELAEIPLNFSVFLQYGALGAMLLIVLAALIFRDRELAAERRARLADARQLEKVLQSNTSAQEAVAKSIADSNVLIEQQTAALLRNTDAALRNAEQIARISGQLSKL